MGGGNSRKLAGPSDTTSGASQRSGRKVTRFGGTGAAVSVPSKEVSEAPPEAGRGVAVGVGTAVWTGVCVGAAVAVGVGVGLATAVGVGLGTAVGVIVGVGAGVGIGVGMTVGVGLGVGDAKGGRSAANASPLASAPPPLLVGVDTGVTDASVLVESAACGRRSGVGSVLPIDSANSLRLPTWARATDERKSTDVGSGVHSPSALL